MSSILLLRFVKQLLSSDPVESKLITILGPRLAKQHLLPFTILVLLSRYARHITVLVVVVVALLYCYVHQASPSVPPRFTGTAR